MLTAMSIVASSCADAPEPDDLDEPDYRGTETGNPSLSDLEVRMDSLVYATNEYVDIEVTLGGHASLGPTIDMVIASPSTSDVELVKLNLVGDRYKAAKAVRLTKTSAVGVKKNGKLNVPAGEMFHAMFYPDPANPLHADIEAQIISDWALMGGNVSGAPTHQIDASLALTGDENLQGHKRAGTLLVENRLPVQVATHELILYPRDQAQLARFLEVTGGTILAQSPIDPEDADEDQDGVAEVGMGLAFLVGLDPAQANDADLPVLRRLFQETEPLMASNAEALDIYSLALALQAEGFKVGVNPRLQFAGAPAQSDPFGVLKSMENSGPEDDCLPNDSTNPCVLNVPSLWAHQALLDADDARVNVGVLDMGFATNDDFRPPAGGTLRECDMTVAGAPDCGPGKAQGSPTVGASLFGERKWHGTGVVSFAGARVDNGQLSAGVAGQTMVPMMYKYDVASYAFEIGEGLRLATDDGASVINVSAGYPCNILTTVGPDFNICTVAGRAGICLLVTASLHAAAGLVCATAGLIPFAGPFICAAAVGGAATATTACISTLALGDVSGPMATGVRHATRRGVPITAVAGNVFQPEEFPPVIRDWIDFDNHVTENWGVIPAIIEPVIAAGSVEDDLMNSNYFGDAVDIWAPIPSRFGAPMDIDDPSSAIEPKLMGGTSSAAPYVAGVIASMQAVDPSLDPASFATDAPERATLVAQVRDILLADANTWSDAELVGLGFTSDARRRKLVDPVAAVQTAAGNSSFDLRTRGYDTTLGFSEQLGTDDTPALARPIAVGEELGGTILDIIDSDVPATIPADRDYYTYDPGEKAFTRSRVALTYPLDPNGDRVRIELDPESTASLAIVSIGGSDDVTVTYAIHSGDGEPVDFAVTSPVGEDNVYRVRLLDIGEPEEFVDIVEPWLPEGEKFCAGEKIDLNAIVGWVGSDAEYPDEDVQWTANGTPIAIGREGEADLPAGTYEIAATAGDATDKVTIEVGDCVGTPPMAEILDPETHLLGDEGLAYTGYDEALGLWYVDVKLEGRGLDLEDGTLPGSSLHWTTSVDELPPVSIGTGTSPFVRLYGHCFGTLHEIGLAVEDSDGNTDTDARAVMVRTTC